MGDSKPTPLSGVKNKDSTRDDEVADAKLVAGADQDLEDSRGKTMGDTTSSSAGANNPGQHGRDGGEIGGQSNNPAPSEAAIDPGKAAAEAEKASDAEAKKDDKDAPKRVI